MRKEDGLLPTVKVTKAWLRKVGEQLKDVEGLQRAANRLYRNPRMPRVDMEGVVADPIGAAYNTIRDSVDGVFDSMGGGEGSDAGALLWEIVRAAVAKDGDEVNELMHEFRHFGRAPVGQWAAARVPQGLGGAAGGGEVLALMF